MCIEELSSRSNLKSITVTLTYDEVRDIANGLYHLTADDKEQAENTKKRLYADYDDIATRSGFLFDMIKYGNIQDHTVRKLHQLQNISQ